MNFEKHQFQRTEETNSNESSSPRKYRKGREFSPNAESVNQSVMEG